MWHVRAAAVWLLPPPPPRPQGGTPREGGSGARASWCSCVWGDWLTGATECRVADVDDEEAVGEEAAARPARQRARHRHHQRVAGRQALLHGPTPGQAMPTHLSIPQAGASPSRPPSTPACGRSDQSEGPLAVRRCCAVAALLRRRRGCTGLKVPADAERHGAHVAHMVGTCFGSTDAAAGRQASSEEAPLEEERGSPTRRPSRAGRGAGP